MLEREKGPGLSCPNRGELNAFVLDKAAEHHGDFLLSPTGVTKALSLSSLRLLCLIWKEEGPVVGRLQVWDWVFQRSNKKGKGT